MLESSKLESLSLYTSESIEYPSSDEMMESAFQGKVEGAEYEGSLLLGLL